MSDITLGEARRLQADAEVQRWHDEQIRQEGWNAAMRRAASLCILTSIPASGAERQKLRDEVRYAIREAIMREVPVTQSPSERDCP